MLYITLDDPRNEGSFAANLAWVQRLTGATVLAYQEPDEWRVDQHLLTLQRDRSMIVEVAGTEHFLTTRTHLADLFRGKRQFLMERFYRDMRQRTGLLMDGDQPTGGTWNFDAENRARPPKAHLAPPPLLFDHDLRELQAMLRSCGVDTMGAVDAAHFIWPLDRPEAVQLLDHFCTHLLPRFGMYQDALMPGQWSLYHSRISFALNVKMLSPMEVCRAVEEAWRADPERISLPQAEGFIRQIIGWREYVRGVYWLNMPGYLERNALGAARDLPGLYWTGETAMACMREAITQTKEEAYAHHIQRLMVTGNFAMLAGVDPHQVHEWYLAVYADAYEWVEAPNTIGMSQFADGGLLGSKPYAGSGAYINRMSDYCKGCAYKVAEKTGKAACPFNYLYWDFMARNDKALRRNPRMAQPYRIYDKFSADHKAAITESASAFLQHLAEHGDDRGFSR
ncbi:MAG: Deoxyribodipyrimidine photo-lyase-related protein [bacterium ADurb.Bin429]|nr:MAG: Deoxyribodipyrimidine photo-lyase-related protein [bacterium ADurb.Bin429]